MGHKNPRQTGEIGSYVVKETKKLQAETNIVTFDGLAGDEATIYRIDGFFIPGTIVGAFIPVLTINNDTSGTNGVDGQYQEFAADLDATYNYDANPDQTEFAFVASNLLAGELLIFSLEMFAKGGETSGHVLKAEVHNSQSTSGKTKLVTGSYDSTDEITSIELRMSSILPNSTYGIGSTFQLSYMG